MGICRMNYHCGILIQAFKNEGTLCIGPNTGVNICSYVTMVTQTLVFSRYSSANVINCILKFPVISRLNFLQMNCTGFMGSNPGV